MLVAWVMEVALMFVDAGAQLGSDMPSKYPANSS